MDIQTTEELAAALDAVTAVGRTLNRTPTVAPSFDDLSLGFVRPQHALDAWAHPDDLAILEFQETRMVAATKARETRNGDFVLLVLGYDRGDGQPMISSGYRLYGEPAEVAELARDARASFQSLLERYAIPFPSEGRHVFFVPVLVVNGLHFDPVALFALKTGPDEAWLVNAAAKQTGDTLTVAWPFVVDSNRYRGDVAAHQR